MQPIPRRGADAFVDTGMNFVGIKDGRAVAIATKADGHDGLRHNAEVLREYGAAGYDVQTHPRAVAVDMHLAALKK